ELRAHLAFSRAVEDQQPRVRSTAVGTVGRTGEIAEEDLQHRVGAAVGTEHMEWPLLVGGYVASRRAEDLGELAESRVHSPFTVGDLPLRRHLRAVGAFEFLLEVAHVRASRSQLLGLWRLPVLLPLGE